jgi:hypothetical protein
MPPTFLFDYFGFARLAMKGEQMTTDSRGYRRFSLSPNHAEVHKVPPTPITHVLAVLQIRESDVLRKTCDKLQFKRTTHHMDFTFVLPCIVIDFFLNNQQHALITQIYSVIKLYMFRHLLCPSLGVFYCIFGIGKFHAGF